MGFLASVVLGWGVMMVWMWIGLKLRGLESPKAFSVAIGGFAATVALAWWAGLLV